MYIKNATYKTVPTGSLSFPLAEGAVVTAGGVTGIVPENVAAAGPTAQIYVAVGGTIDLTSEANKGVSFTDEQIKALGSDFNFVPASEKELPTPTLADAGKVVAVNETGTEYELVESGGGLPEVTSSDEGKVLAVNASGEWAAENPYDIVFRIDADEGVPQSVTAIVFNEQSVLDKMAVDAPISIYAFAKSELNLVIQYNAVNIRYYYPLDDRFLAVEMCSVYKASGIVKLDNCVVIYSFEDHEWFLD